MLLLLTYDSDVINPPPTNFPFYLETSIKFQVKTRILYCSGESEFHKITLIRFEIVQRPQTGHV